MKYTLAVSYKSGRIIDRYFKDMPSLQCWLFDHEAEVQSYSIYHFGKAVNE
jgi:hypothetical protein